jgi:hypothetical protein
MAAKITEREILAGMTKKGGFTRDQLAKWGVPFPPPKGWKKALLQGKPISGEAKEEKEAPCLYAKLLSVKNVKVTPRPLRGYFEEYVEPYTCTIRTYQII